MRFPSRPVLAASVCAALAASGGAVITLPQQAADAADITLDPAANSTGLGAPQSPDPSVAGPPVSGAQIAGLALAPARERASALAAERAAAAAEKAAQEQRAREEAERQQDDEGDADRERPHRSGNSDWEEFRRELREACDEGRIRGQICRGA